MQLLIKGSDQIDTRVEKKKAEKGETQISVGNFKRNLIAILMPASQTLQGGFSYSLV